VSSLLEQTRPWASAAGGGPTLRGRRTDAGAQTIHFFPGNGFCGAVYWDFLKRLLPAHGASGDVGLFLHDIEGHGASDAPPAFSGAAAIARRVPEVLREQRLDGQTLIGMGHSFGGALSLKCAVEHPGLFRALVLLDPITLPPLGWFLWRGMGRLGINPMAKAARTRRSTWPSHDDALLHLRGRGIFRGWTEEALRDFVDHAMGARDGQWVLRCPPELEAQIYEHPIWCWPLFRKVQVPVLFLYGAQSYPFFPTTARRARRRHPKLEIGTVPGAHCFMLQHPDEAAARVREWLARLPA
jgi:pimeloyl-ACP methyl ester carboxylesterase